MSKALEKELDEQGIDLTAHQFRQIIEQTHKKLFPEFNDEQLLQRPTLSVQFVGGVRSRCPSPSPSEDLICRTLMNIRKQSRKKKGK
jgi:hypothetical protein